MHGLDIYEIDRKKPVKFRNVIKSSSRLIVNSKNTKRILLEKVPDSLEPSIFYPLLDTSLIDGLIKINDDDLIGGALSSLCRNAQRTLDTTRLAELSFELENLSKSSGDEKWMMKRAHMNAEMWRLVGNMKKAEAFYNESMRISESIGAMGMFTIDHFNKSFVSTATGDFAEARRLITKYYALRYEADPKSEDAYGLIALAYLLEQEGDLKGALEVATVTRRLFKEQNIFPEPPDEKPLIGVEKSILKKLKPEMIKKIEKQSLNQSVHGLLTKYFN